MEPETQDSVSASDALLDAFEAEFEAGIEDSAQFSKRPPESESNAGEEPEEAEAAADGEEASEPEPDGEEAEADAPDGDYVEHEGQKFALGDLLAAHQWKQQTEASLEQLRHQVIEQGRGHIEQARTEWTNRFQQLADTYEMIQALAPVVERPPLSMLEPGAPDYNPDGYHWWLRQYEETTQRRSQAARTMQLARQQAEAEQAQQRQALVADNAAKIRAKFPNFGQKEAAELGGFLKSSYGFDDETIASVIDHRFFELAMDAQAYRAAKAKGAPKPAGEAKAAPRLVRSAPKATPAQGQNSRRKADALKQLQKSGKVTDREAIFGDFIT